MINKNIPNNSNIQLLRHIPRFSSTHVDQRGQDHTQPSPGTIARTQTPFSYWITLLLQSPIWITLKMPDTSFKPFNSTAYYSSAVNAPHPQYHVTKRLHYLKVQVLRLCPKVSNASQRISK